MHRHIDTGLDQLKEQLITMSGYVEEAIDLSIRAWRERDRGKLVRVLEIEDKVNTAHKDVDAICLKILATQHPLAMDLRFIMAVIKINSDLERMVDQAVNIAHNTEFYLKFPPAFQVTDLNQMSDEVRFMVREAIDAFVTQGEVLARNVIRADDKVDDYKDKIFRDVQALMKKDPNLVEQGLTVILIARNLERIGDHSTNIAEDVIFSISGQDIRHEGVKK